MHSSLRYGKRHLVKPLNRTTKSLNFVFTEAKVFLPQTCFCVSGFCVVEAFLLLYSPIPREAPQLSQPKPSQQYSGGGRIIRMSGRMRCARIIFRKIFCKVAKTQSNAKVNIMHIFFLAYLTQVEFFYVLFLLTNICENPVCAFQTFQKQTSQIH